MKILELRLIAYGPFTEALIDLRAGCQGLHLIYGPNEAGKSSALRALRALLYGIPERSSDDFLHPYGKMRIGAVIQHSSGQELVLIRRKGRNNTLRKGDDQEVLDESVLRRFINEVDPDLFATMFGLGYADLVRGGQEITKGGGSVGRIIFTAGSGIANLREVQEELQTEADSLFRPSGQKPRINEAIADLNRKQKALREAQLPGQLWVEHAQALREASARKESVAQRLQHKQRDWHRLDRIREALPLITRRTELLDELHDYATAVLLPENFGEQRRARLTNLRLAAEDRDQARHEIESIQSALAGLELSESLLENADRIEAVYRELGSQHKAAKDRAQLLTRRNVLHGEAREILRSLRDNLSLEDAERLRIKRSDTVRIQELGAQFERIVTRIEGSREEIAKLTQTIDVLKAEFRDLDEPQRIESLKDAVEQAAAFGALEKHYRSESAEIESMLKKLQIEVTKQSLWSGTSEALETLPVPPLETITMLENQNDEAARQAAELEAEIGKINAELEEYARQLATLRLQQEVPTENDLQTARNTRDHGWQFVHATLEGKPVPEKAVQAFIQSFPAAEGLATAFRASVAQADAIADRLRREADRVATKAKLLADQDARQKRLQRVKAGLAVAAHDHTAIQREWVRLWEPAGIAPRTPKEMRVWAQNFKNLAEKATEIRERQAKADDLLAKIDAHREALSRCFLSLAEPPAREEETLGDLIKRGRKVVEHEVSLRQERKQLHSEIKKRARELAEARSRVARSEDELAQWQSRWQQAVQPLGLGVDAVPSQANAVLEELKNLFDKLKEAEVIQKRIDGIDRDTAEFVRKVSALTDSLAPDLAELPPDQAVFELNGRLTRNRSALSTKQTLAQQLIKETDRERRAAKALTEIESQLNSMCAEAGCERYEDLPEAERRSSKRQQIESDLTLLNQQLFKLSAGAAVDDFIQDALKVDPDGIDVEIQRLAEQTEELHREKSELDQTIGSERTALGQMDGSARAAELAEETQMILGRIENDVERYARLKIAAVVLNLAMERYREKNQDPILKRAHTFFGQLTQGSFEGLRIEFDEQGQPVLVGVRPGGQEIVGVDGMSDGTADQLYLAIRLAGLEEYLANNEPIPFIVDDILIKFDNDRAVAALKALAHLSQKTQVIFFTHHRHLLELAAANIDPAVLIQHTLGP
ncbi:MAG: AAA family ATPase [Desulfobacterales bacterium]|nr:MAG: AAA family ATPase [Desulfobacterales bacterium]